ncbi:MAG: class I SAM-dependent methyltransferase [Verrucomicrobiota bacterium]
MRLTEIAHSKVAEHLQSGDCAIDCTMGNGYDTLFLARQIGPQGTVIAFDIQREALHSTKALLNQNATTCNIDLHAENHKNIEAFIPHNWHQNVNAIMFNLGYRPRGDKSICTLPETTIPALNSSLEILSLKGILSVLVYPGHSEGQKEQKAIQDWQATLTKESVEVIRPSDQKSHPYLLLVRKATCSKANRSRP